METKFKKLSELIETGESPIDLSVISNYMGINLCSVDSLEWTRQDDGQLVDLKINFIPATEAETKAQGENC